MIITLLGEDIDVDMSAQQMPLMFVAILLVFRTGYAYGRYMEGRGHVGTMVLKGARPGAVQSPIAAPLLTTSSPLGSPRAGPKDVHLRGRGGPRHPR